MTTLAERGLRATWLLKHLTGHAGLALVPKDRDVLTLVALSSGPLERETLAQRLRAMGHADPDPLIGRMLTGGFLAGEVKDGRQLLDLPDEDVAWIRAQIQGAAAC